MCLEGMQGICSGYNFFYADRPAREAEKVHILELNVKLWGKKGIYGDKDRLFYIIAI